MTYFVKLHSAKEGNEIWLRPNLILAIAQVKYKDLNNKAYSGTEVTYNTGTKEVTKALVKETPTEILKVMRKALADYCEDHTKIGELPQGQTGCKNRYDYRLMSSVSDLMGTWTSRVYK